MAQLTKWFDDYNFSGSTLGYLPAGLFREKRVLN
jgi:hypothetical protein